MADGQTDGIGVAYARYSIYAVARNKMRMRAATVVQVLQDLF